MKLSFYCRHESGGKLLHRVFAVFVAFWQPKVDVNVDFKAANEEEGGQEMATWQHRAGESAWFSNVCET